MMSLSQMLAAKAGGPGAIQPGKPANPIVLNANPYGPKGPSGMPAGPVAPQPAARAPLRRPGALSMPMGGGGYGATYQAMGGPGGGYAQPFGAPQPPQPRFGRVVL